MKKGVLFTGGEGPDCRDEALKLLSYADLYGAADSGIYLAEKFGIRPDFIVGDMDSVKNAETIINRYSDAEIHVFNHSKDETDTEIGLRFLKDKGCDEIFLAGGAGGRIDHFLGIYMLFFKDLHPDVWILKNEVVYRIKDYICLDTEPGETLSIFPVSVNKCRMKSSGLIWELDRLDWKAGDAGISNIAEGRTVEIKVNTGRLVLIKQLK